jgi:hypothetical protein
MGAVDTGFEAFGEITDLKTRAELVDEGLDILTGLWHGQPFNYAGKHYQIQETNFFPPPPPVQEPRIPIWVVGAWPRMKSMRRVLRYDGLIPNVMGEDGKPREISLDDIRAMKAYVEAQRTATTPFDIIMEGETPGDQPQQALDLVSAWAEAGATWWIESRWSEPRTAEGFKAVQRRVEQGPPK